MKHTNINYERPKIQKVKKNKKTRYINTEYFFNP